MLFPYANDKSITNINCDSEVLVFFRFVFSFKCFVRISLEQPWVRSKSGYVSLVWMTKSKQQYCGAIFSSLGFIAVSCELNKPSEISCVERILALCDISQVFPVSFSILLLFPIFRERKWCLSSGIQCETSRNPTFRRQFPRVFGTIYRCKKSLFWWCVTESYPSFCDTTLSGLSMIPGFRIILMRKFPVLKKCFNVFPASC